MKVAVVYNRDRSGVINVMKVQNQETYDPKTVEAVAGALEAGGHNVHLVDGNMHVIDRLREFMPRVIAGDRPGMVFNMAYGIQGVSRYTHLPGMLEMLGVPYVGSNPQAHALALDKVIAKILFQSQGIPTPGFWNFATPDDHYDDITYPVIVKPKMEGMSLGLKIVRGEKELRDAVARIIEEFRQHVLVEQFIAGREFTVGLLGNGDVEALPVVELDLRGDAKRIRDDEGRDPLQKICPAPLSRAQTEHLQDIARRAFLALGLHDYGRIDVRMDEDGNPYVLEINSMADLGQDGAYVFSAKQAGYSYEALINRILNVAAARCFGAEAVEEAAARAGSKAKVAVSQSLSTRVRGFLRSQSSTVDDTIDTLAELGTPPRILERMESQLELVGFQRSPDVDAPATKLAYFKNHSQKRDRLLLVASVQPMDHSEPLRRSDDGNRIYGAGALETIGGLTVMLSALRALRFAGALRDIQCGILLALGADDASSEQRNVLMQIAASATRVFGMGASDREGSLILSRLGEQDYRLEARYLRHPKRVLHPRTVLESFCQKVTAIQGFANTKRGTEISFTRVHLEGEFRDLPESAEAELTATFQRPAQGNLLDKRIRRIASQRASDGIEYEVTVGAGYPPLVESRTSRALYRQVERLAREIHVQVTAARYARASILNLMADGPPCLDGFGPIAGLEGEEHYIVRHSLWDRATLVSLAAHRLSGSPSR